MSPIEGDDARRADFVLLLWPVAPGIFSTGWRSGDLFETAFAVPLPPDLAPGACDVAAVLYDDPKIDRLPLTDGADLLYLPRLTFPPPAG